MDGSSAECADASGDGGTNGSVVRDAGSGEASAGADEGTCGVRAAPEIMTQIYTVLAISSTISRVGGGFLADRVAPRLLLASALLLQALSLALVARLNSRWVHGRGARTSPGCPPTAHQLTPPLW